MKFSTTFAGVLSVALSSSLAYAGCPAIGSSDSQGRYGCNPAHAYPSGQTCTMTEGCYYLNTNGTTPCPATGATDSQGRYSCNPAHAYPNGQTCTMTDGCYYLSSNGKPVNNYSNGTTPCPASGTTDSQGRYSCNPAHSYPNGQTCISIDGCYYLCSGGKPIVNPTSTETLPGPQPTIMPTGGAATLQAAGGLLIAAVLGAFVL